MLLDSFKTQKEAGGEKVVVCICAIKSIPDYKWEFISNLQIEFPLQVLYVSPPMSPFFLFFFFFQKRLDITGLINKPLYFKRGINKKINNSSKLQNKRHCAGKWMSCLTVLKCLRVEISFKGSC